jgi:hypothetical protein
MSLVERLLRIDHVPVAIRSPTWRKRTSEFCFVALAEYPERAMVKPPAARERLLSEAGRQVSFSGSE